MNLSTIGRCAGLAALLTLAAAAPAQRHPAAAARGETIGADPEESVQAAASVVQLNELHRQGALGGKVFGTAGGDPAMNGLYTYLAFYVSPGDDWRVFRLGDFMSYRIVAEAPGRIVLAIQESIMNQRTGTIGSRTRRLTISWTVRGETPPARISVSALP